MKQWIRNLCPILFCISCVSVNSKNEIPPIVKTMPLEEGLTLAINNGGKTLADVKKILLTQERRAEAAKIVEGRILDSSETYTPPQLIAAVNLYQHATKKISLKVIEKLIFSEEIPPRQLGWELAARHPDERIAEFIDKELTEIVTKGEEEQVLLPEMAKAVQSNKVASVYTLLREGLYRNGQDSFAKAMAYLNPEQASYDFMEYLGQASIEDLRQINQTTVNQYTCLVILQHYLNHVPPFGHAKIDSLFYYAVSRNQGLSELAHFVIEKHVPQNQSIISMKLARLPVWVQVAFVEGTSKNFSSNMRVFLSHLRQNSAHLEVIEEIDAVRY